MTRHRQWSVTTRVYHIMKRTTIPEHLMHLIPQKFEKRHAKFIRSQLKTCEKGLDAVYHISASSGVGVSVVLENMFNHETIDLTDYDSW